MDSSCGGTGSLTSVGFWKYCKSTTGMRRWASPQKPGLATLLYSLPGEVQTQSQKGSPSFDILVASSFAVWQECMGNQCWCP
jgi:hypothetical protein